MANLIRCDQCGMERQEQAIINWWSLDILGRSKVMLSEGMDLIKNVPHHFCSLECLGTWANSRMTLPQIGTKRVAP